MVRDPQIYTDHKGCIGISIGRSLPSTLKPNIDRKKSKRELYGCSNSTINRQRRCKQSDCLEYRGFERRKLDVRLAKKYLH